MSRRCVQLVAYPGTGTWGRVLHSVDYLHHHSWLLMMMTLLLALTPCGRSYSLDRWLALRRAEAQGHPPPKEQGDLWALRIMALQLSAVYFWAAYDKMTSEFLSGARLEQLLLYYYTGSTWLDSRLVHWVLKGAAVCVLASELFLAGGLFVVRWQKRTIPAAILLHWTMFLAVPVWIFSAQMTLYFLVFVPTDEVHDFLDTFNTPRIENGQPNRDSTGL